MSKSNYPRISCEDIRPGDVVRYVRTWKADAAQQPSQLKTHLSPVPGDHYELVYRPKRKPKPPVGAILSALEVRDTRWKRGTKVAYLPRNGRTQLFILTLGEDGWWHGSEGRYGFNEIQDDYDYWILFDRPKEEGE